MGRFTEAQGAEQPSGSQEPRLVSGEVLVDDGGVHRKVVVEDLVKRASAAERALAEAKTISEVAKAQMARDAGLMQLGQRIEAMSSDQRNALMKALQNPDSLLRATNPSPLEDPFAPPAPAGHGAFEDRISQIEKLATASAQVLAQFGQERQAQTVNQRIESEMAGLPIFGRVPPELRESAKEAIQNALMRQPQADLSEIVLANARKVDAINKRYQPPGLVPQPSPTGDGQPARRFNSRDLVSGDVLSAAREAARQAGVVL